MVAHVHVLAQRHVRTARAQALRATAMDSLCDGLLRLRGRHKALRGRHKVGAPRCAENELALTGISEASIYTIILAWGWRSTRTLATSL